MTSKKTTLLPESHRPEYIQSVPKMTRLLSPILHSTKTQSLSFSSIDFIQAMAEDGITPTGEINAEIQIPDTPGASIQISLIKEFFPMMPGKTPDEKSILDQLYRVMDDTALKVCAILITAFMEGKRVVSDKEICAKIYRPHVKGGFRARHRKKIQDICSTLFKCEVTGPLNLVRAGKKLSGSHRGPLFILENTVEVPEQGGGTRRYYTFSPCQFLIREILAGQYSWLDTRSLRLPDPIFKLYFYIAEQFRIKGGGRKSKQMIGGWIHITFPALVDEKTGGFKFDYARPKRSAQALRKHLNQLCGPPNPPLLAGWEIKNGNAHRLPKETWYKKINWSGSGTDGQLREVVFWFLAPGDLIKILSGNGPRQLPPDEYEEIGPTKDKE